jgi:hypothetical protein
MRLMKRIKQSELYCRMLSQSIMSGEKNRYPGGNEGQIEQVLPLRNDGIAHCYELVRNET